MQELTSILIPVFNNLQYTRGCLDSIFENINQIKSSYEVLIYDNGSTDGTTQYLQGLVAAGKIKAIYSKDNKGFPFAMNRLAEIAKGEYLWLCNNDIVITKNALENMLRCIKLDPKLAAVGPYSNMNSGNHQSPISCTYKNNDELQKFGATYSQEENYVDFLVFFCTLIKKEVYWELGGLDEDMSPGNFEDNEWCWFAVQKGYKIKICGNAFVHHYVSKTWQKEDPKKLAEYARIMARNQKIFLKKIGKYKTISLCMIVSDKEKPEILKRCLDSIAQWVDEINIVFNYKHFPLPSEKHSEVKDYKRPKRFNGQAIFGNVENWEQLQRPKLNAKYIKFTDFSDMRNKSLDMATSDYIIWLDADDIMETPAGIRDLILKCPDVDVLKCRVISHTPQGTAETIIHNRIFKNKKEYRFRNRVHEDISFSMAEQNATRTMTSLTISHHGYLSEKQRKQKNLRNYNLVIQDYDDGIRHSLIYYALVNCLIIMGGKDNLLKALKFVDECFEHCQLKHEDPLTSKMWTLRGIICMDSGQMLAAKQSFHKAYDEWKQPEAAVNLAEIYMREQNWDKAIEILMTIYEQKEFKMQNFAFDIKHVEILMLEKLADAWARKALVKEGDNHKYNPQECMQKAELHYTEALRVDPNNLKIADRLCQILRNTNRVDQAAFIIIKAVNRHPGYFAGYNNLAAYEIMNQRYSTARIFLKEALRLKPDFKEAQINLKGVEGVLSGRSHKAIT